MRDEKKTKQFLVTWKKKKVHFFSSILFIRLYFVSNGQLSHTIDGVIFARSVFLQQFFSSFGLRCVLFCVRKKGAVFSSNRNY